MDKLRECPFCGGDDVCCEDYGRNTGLYYIQCHECEALIPHFESKRDAIKAWNTRYEPPTPGGAIVPAGNERLK